MSRALWFILFVGSWVGFATWAKTKKGLSGTIAFGGGLVVACFVLVAGAKLSSLGQGGSGQQALSAGTSDSSGLPQIEYSDDTASYVEISDCVIQGAPGAQLVDCHFKNKTPNFTIGMGRIGVFFYDAKGVKLGDRTVPDVSIAPGETAKSRLLAADDVSEVRRIKVFSR